MKPNIENKCVHYLIDAYNLLELYKNMLNLKVKVIDIQTQFFVLLYAWNKINTKIL